MSGTVVTRSLSRQHWQHMIQIPEGHLANYDRFNDYEDMDVFG